MFARLVPVVLSRVALVFGLLSPCFVHAADVWPQEKWTVASAAEAGLDEAQLKRARDYALTGGDHFSVRRAELKLAR